MFSPRSVSKNRTSNFTFLDDDNYCELRRCRSTDQMAANGVDKEDSLEHPGLDPRLITQNSPDQHLHQNVPNSSPSSLIPQSYRVPPRLRRISSSSQQSQEEHVKFEIGKNGTKNGSNTSLNSQNTYTSYQVSSAGHRQFERVSFNTHVNILLLIHNL